MSQSKTITGILSVFVVMPIWYYLMYRLLAATDQDRLVWFLFWVYIPVNLFVRILCEIASADQLTRQ